MRRTSGLRGERMLSGILSSLWTMSVRNMPMKGTQGPSTDCDNARYAENPPVGSLNCSKSSKLERRLTSAHVTCRRDTTVLESPASRALIEEKFCKMRDVCVQSVSWSQDVKKTHLSDLDPKVDCISPASRSLRLQDAHFHQGHQPVMRRTEFAQTGFLSLLRPCPVYALLHMDFAVQSVL